MPITADLVGALGRGNLESQEKGSGARADIGKPNWGLMPLTQISSLVHSNLLREGPNPEDPITLEDCLFELSMFQRSGRRAGKVLEMSFAYLMDTLDADFWDVCEEVIRVWEHGENKYASFNWMKGMSWNSIIGCYMRHYCKLAKGLTIDEESGRHHGAHLICNAMMLVHYQAYYPEGNDLPIKWYKLEPNNGNDQA